MKNENEATKFSKLDAFKSFQVKNARAIVGGETGDQTHVWVNDAPISHVFGPDDLRFGHLGSDTAGDADNGGGGTQG